MTLPFTKSKPWLAVAVATVFAGAIIVGGIFNGYAENSVVLEDIPLNVEKSSFGLDVGSNMHVQEQTKSSTAQRNLQALNSKSLKQNFQVAKAKMIQQLKDDYGAELFDKNFMTDWKNGTERVTQGRRFFLSPSVQGKDRKAMNDANEGPSWDRLVRRLAIKILDSQLGGGSSSVPFVWATGGHSSAAAHGNFYNESYTATLERTGKGVFEAVGLNLVGRNYAMGGTSSGFELSSCVKEIYGKDVDILSWDFGMTDGRLIPQRMEHYAIRSQVDTNRPAIFGFGIKSGKEKILKRLEEYGMTTLYELESIYSAILKEMPTCDGRSPSQVEAMPRMVRECRCEEDKGVMTCSEAKWSKYGNATCDKRKFQTSWHPGWKWHGLVGNLLALSLMEVIGDAVNLIDSRGSDPQALLKQLKNQQIADYRLFAESPIPEQALVLLKQDQHDVRDPPTGIDVTALYKGPNVCHTARLPAETRHWGILTDSKDKGFHFYDYEKGIPYKDATTTTDDSLTPLVYNPADRQACVNQLNMDYKDWFHVGSSQHWSKIVVPNRREVQTYNNKKQQALMKGYVVMCFVPCPFRKCPKDTVQHVEAITENRAEIRVNGKPVTQLQPFGSDCVFLKGRQGYSWPRNSNDQYEVSAKVKEEGNNMRVSSVVLYKKI